MNPKTSLDLFNKIRSQFSNIQVGDESGLPTADPAQAVFFEFEFKEDADTYGAVSVSLADGENMKVFYNRDLVNKIDEDSKTEWFAFLIACSILYGSTSKAYTCLNCLANSIAISPSAQPTSSTM